MNVFEILRHNIAILGAKTFLPCFMQIIERRNGYIVNYSQILTAAKGNNYFIFIWGLSPKTVWPKTSET